MASINEKFIVNLKGKDFVTYEGLLDLAHQKGLKSIDVELLQIPSQDNQNTAIVKTTVRTEKEAFVDIGDASPKSVNSMIGPHIIRMASTRAKARALRDLTNVGMTALEEIMEDESQNYSKPQGQASQAKPQTTNQEQGVLQCSDCSEDINQAVKGYSTKNFGKELCFNCQKKYRK